MYDSLSRDTPAAEYVLEQAWMLGVPTRMARSDLHVVKAHQKVLELPGLAGSGIEAITHGWWPLSGPWDTRLAPSGGVAH